MFAAPRVRSQTSTKPGPQSSPYSAVKSFRIVQEKDGPAVEILSTKPLIPSIQAIGDPPRLVIDLPNARLDTKQKRISVQADQISTLRADQFQQNPPVARVVVDLLAPRAYTWAAAGNRLLVHLGRNPPTEANKSPFQAPSVVSLTLAPQPVAAVRTAGPLAVAGNTLASGSSITAGADTAILNLARGGEVHVCPGTTVSVTPSQSGHNVMLGVNTGALEAHYALDASSDSVITPDFRILLSGPGEFHYAISTDTHGNTCVRALPGNTASAIVSELLGDRTYQVKATDQLVFHFGQLDRVDMAVPLECGCPPPRQPVLRASNDLPVISEAQAPANPNQVAIPASTETAHTESATSDGMPVAATPTDNSAASNELHVQVEAPFVFRATGPPPAPVEDVRALPLDTRPLPAPALSAPLPPAHGRKPAGTVTASADPSPRRGFFRKLGGFFAAMFR
ncbi:MAG: AMIN domain-containing protein [Acidobacteriales bacterium]|nr:AMIN domain-containing protein [Terriglobales bacterium]